METLVARIKKAMHMHKAIQVHNRNRVEVKERWNLRQEREKLRRDAEEASRTDHRTLSSQPLSNLLRALQHCQSPGDAAVVGRQHSKSPVILVSQVRWSLRHIRYHCSAPSSTACSVVGPFLGSRLCLCQGGRVATGCLPTPRIEWARAL